MRPPLLKLSLVIPSLAALALLVVTVTPSPAHASCFPWKCCDSWGYDYPGVYVSKNSCENNGGEVQCGATCSNQSLAPFKCCDADGYPFPGVYLGRHECKVSGGTIFDNAVICPNSADVAFQCCDPDGGGAPGVYVFRENCRDDGYVVQEDFTFGGCPGGWVDQVKEFFSSLKNAKQCSIATYKHYTQPDGSSLIDGWRDDYLATDPAPEVWSDKDTHCVLNCLLTVRCGRPAAALAGWARETLQMCDNDALNAWGYGDECANRLGREYGDTLTDTDPYESQCVSHCTGIAGLENICAGPLGGLVGVVQDASLAIGAPDPVVVIQSHIDGFQAALGDTWTAISNKCIELLSPLDANAAAGMAERLRDIEAQGLELLATAGPLADGTIARVAAGLGGIEALVQVPEPGVRTVLLTSPVSKVDALLSFEGDHLSAMEFRGANRKSVVMTTAAPQAVACSTPPCEVRVPWVQWTVTREAMPEVTP